MSSVTDDGSAAEQDPGDERASDPTPPPASGDLEFDEAWGGAAAAGTVPGRGARDTDPSFEDPNDR